MSRPTVADVIVRTLADSGVRFMFGIPGDAINALVDALRREDRIELIQVRHEEAGAFAASAQAKLTGQPAACVGTAGAGAIHLLNGLYDARKDQAPVIAITGQVDTAQIGHDAHQEVDLYALFKDVAAYNHTVMTPRQAARMAKEACNIARCRSTVTHLAIPADIATEEIEGETEPIVIAGQGTLIPPDDDLERAAEVLNEAEKVFILAGIGCTGAREELGRVAELLRAPVALALRGREVLPDDHPNYIGGSGLLGGRAAVEAARHCDALLLVGTDFPYREFLPRDVPAVQIDVSAQHLGRRYPVTVGLHGHAAPALDKLAKRLEPKTDDAFLQRWRKARRVWEDFLAMKEKTGDQERIAPQQLARLAGERADDDAIFCCGTGEVTVWTARYMRLRGNQRLTLSSSLASMAYELPAAIGAQLAYPDRQVVALCGDGGFTMLAADFLTAIRYDLPITCVVFNNGKLGMIKDEQEKVGLPAYAIGLEPFDFVKFAEACGGGGRRVTRPEDLDSALDEAYGSDRPFILDVAIDPEVMPLPPKLTLSQAMGFGKARFKEWLFLNHRDGD